MESPTDYLSENESIDENEYDEELEDVTSKIMTGNEKPMKLSSLKVTDEEEDEEEEEEEEEEDLEEYPEEIENPSDIDGENEEELQNYEKEIIPQDVKLNISDEEDDDSDYDDEYYQKFDSELKQDYMLRRHSNLLQNNYDEVETLSKLTAVDGVIDKLHKTVPILTKYEKTRVLGLRSKQLEEGSLPLIEINKSIIDPYLIANMELEEKKIPFIIRRPLPNGTSEYWKLKDLEVVCD